MSLPFPPKVAGPAYLTQCACFACRKSFKKDLADPRFTPQCPECGRALVPMGRYFRAPRKTDAAQWKKVEMLSRAGVYFGGRQSGELGQFPDTLREAKDFIARNAALLRKRVEARDRWRASAVVELEQKKAKRRAARLKAKSAKKPNQALEPTTTAGTSAAKPPRVPAAVVAHL